MPQHAPSEPQAADRPQHRPRSRLGPKSRLGRTLCRRFRRDAGGATAVEFALVSVPFFALIFAIIETALTFLTTQVLETAVETTSRLLYTGQFQQANQNASTGDLATAFKTEFCKYYVGLTPCSSVKIDVQAYPNNTFPGSLPSPITTDSQGNRVVDPNFGAFNKPGGNQIVVVRAVSENPVFVSLLNPNQSNLSNGKRLIVGTAAFKTEPFTSN